MNGDVCGHGGGKKTYELSITLERDQMMRDEAIMKAARLASQLMSIGLSGEVRVSDTENREIVFLSKLIPD